MKVYRITLAQFSCKLYASGQPARWNSKGTFVIYSASSRALACLENLVHRSGEGLSSLFKTMIIHIPGDVEVEQIKPSMLPSNWSTFAGQAITSKMGDEWVRSGESSVLKVPSAIIPEENNYIINPAHPDSSRIKLEGVEEFMFDGRLSR